MAKQLARLKDFFEIASHVCKLPIRGSAMNAALTSLQAGHTP